MKITNTRIYNMEESIVASGFPMRSDDVTSTFETDIKDVRMFLMTRNENYNEESARGKKHYDRAIKLGRSEVGAGHNSYLKGIIVTCNITADKVFWSQWQRYHHHDIVSSMSFMHRLSKLEIDEKMFDPIIIKRFKEMVDFYNTNEWESNADKSEYFEHIVSNAPSGIELTAHIYTNYLQLMSQYKQRKYHKRDSWRVKFIDWCNNLPAFKELTGL